MLKIMITGGRDAPDDYVRAEFKRRLLALENCNGELMLIAGGATGFDTWAADYARSQGIHVAEVRPLWDSHGKAAGPIRNAAMLQLNPRLLIAAPGGRGTASAVALAKKAGLVIIHLGEDE